MKPVLTAFRLSPAFAAAIAASGPLDAAPSEPAALHVTVTGLHSADGQLIACLWSEKPGFPNCSKSETALRKIIAVDGSTMHISLPLPSAGQYAVTVVHDEDGNGKMKRNFIGMPTEGVGVSNNPGGMPGFNKSLIDAQPGGTITIRMKYLFD